MKLKNLKYWALAGLMALGSVSISAQALRHPTNSRFLGGGYTNSRPYFKTLDAALNDVKALATAENPYVFWVMSDTLYIADWDSVYQSGGLRMKDSIDVHYVANGYISWAGMGQGGGGSGGITSINPPENQTTHYDFYTWTGQSNNSLWQTRLGMNADSIDERIWELIVYTDSVYLYIENDTLKIRESTISDLVTATGTRPDTTIIAYKAEDEAITGDWIFSGDISVSTGSIRMAVANYNTGVSRILWSHLNEPYWSGTGAIGDSSQVLMVNTSTGALNIDSLITWSNLNQAIKDSITLGAGLIYFDHHIYKDAPSTVSLLTGGGWLTIGTFIAGESLGFTSSTDSSVTVATDGLYEIEYSISYTGNNTQVLEGGVFIDDVLHEGSGFWRKIGTGADVGSSSGTDLVALSAGEVIELKLRSPGTTGDITVHICNFNMTRID